MPEQTPLVGRQRELTILRARIASGGGGGAIIVDGPPGIGKATVVDAALAGLPSAIRVRRCDVNGRRDPWADRVRSAVATSADVVVADRLELLEDHTRALLPQIAERARRHGALIIGQLQTNNTGRQAARREATDGPMDRLALDGLSPSEVQALIRALGSPAQSRAAVTAIHNTTGGNPSLVLELVAALNGSRADPLPPSAWRRPPPLLNR